MRSPYGLEIIESCVSCKLRVKGLFCDISAEALERFETIKYTSTLPRGALLFVEGQSPRGIFLLCSGRVKLSTCSSEGRTLITQIAESGEVIGLSAIILNRPFEVTAETISPCQVNFVRRDDFLRFLTEHTEAYLRVAEHLSNSCHISHAQVQSLGLSHSTAEKLARLILGWCERDGRLTERGIQVKLTLTHEEIAQLIGASRETVTRLLSDFKGREIAILRDSNLLVPDKNALQSLIT